MEDEPDDRIKKIWELFVDIELGHLQAAASLFCKYENRDPEEVIGSEIVIPCRFKSQKAYVQKVLEKEVDKRLESQGEFTTIKALPEDWPSYDVQMKQMKSALLRKMQLDLQGHIMIEILLQQTNNLKTKKSLY